MPRPTTVMSMDAPVLKDPTPFDVVRAGALMREALLLLDHGGANLAAVQLQHAIDTLDIVPSVAMQE